MRLLQVAPTHFQSSFETLTTTNEEQEQVQHFICLCEGVAAETSHSTTSYLCLAPLTRERNAVREMHNCLVLLQLLCALNDTIVCEAERRSSECTLAQQTLIVQLEGSKEGWMNGCFSVHKWPL